MNDETTPTEGWAAVGAVLVHADRIVGSLSTPELAEWVAEACETLAEMEAAQAEWEASGEAPHCAMVDIDGEQMRVQGGADWTEQDRREMGQILSAAKRRMAEAKAAERAEIEREIRAQVGDEIAALRHDGPMSANGTADRAFTNALVIAERTARGGAQ